MDKRIIYPLPADESGHIGVGILIPAENAREHLKIANEVLDDEGNIVSPSQYRPETDEEFLGRLAAKDLPPGTEFKIVDVSVIPTDRTFRDAWEYPA